MDALISCYIDADLDGFGAGTPVAVSSDTNCANREDEDFDASNIYARNNQDCLDTDSSVFPGSAENEAGSLCMKDSDGDGFGDAELSGEELALGVVAGQDCDDSSGSIAPNVTEQAADLIDANCDGQELCYIDSDGDGYGSSIATITSSNLNCDGANESVNTTDCDDNSAVTYPGAAYLDSVSDCMKDTDLDGYGDISPPKCHIVVGRNRL